MPQSKAYRQPFDNAIRIAGESGAYLMFQQMKGLLLKPLVLKGGEQWRHSRATTTPTPKKQTTKRKQQPWKEHFAIHIYWNDFHDVG